MNKLLGGAVAVALAFSLAGCQDMNKQQIGSLTGAAVGGLVGSQFGKGTGQIVGAVGGTILGGFIGGSIGASMDKQDRMEMQMALEKSRIGHTTSWRNPDNGRRYTVRPTKTYKRSSGQYCREYITTATIAGKTQQMYGTACRQPDGSWKNVSSR